MSFMGNLKHTLSIGVRVTADEATSGFRQVSNAAQQMLDGQRQKLRQLNAEVKSYNDREAAASREASAIARAASREIDAKGSAYKELTRTIEGYKQKLAEIKKAAPTGEAAYSEEYKKAKAANAAADAQIASIRKVTEAKKAAAKEEIELLRSIAREDAVKIRRSLDEKLAAQSRNTQRTQQLRSADLAEKGAVSAPYKTAMSEYERRAGSLAATRENLVDLKLQREVLQRGVELGTRSAQALKAGYLNEDAIKERYAQIETAQKTGKITPAYAAQLQAEMRSEGAFRSEEEARRFAFAHQAQLVGVNEKITASKILAEQQKAELSAQKATVTSTVKATPEAIARAEERIRLIDRGVKLRAEIATDQAKLRGVSTTTEGEVAQVKSELAKFVSSQAKAIAQEEAKKVALPEKGQSEAARRNLAEVAQTNALIQAKTNERSAVEKSISDTKAKRDEDLAANRRRRDDDAKAAKAAQESRDAARAAVQAKKDEVAAIREASRAMRSQLVGAITTAVAKLAMTFQSIKAILNATRSAENFEFSARSVSALLGERRPAGEALYNQYLAKYGATQGEVMPVAAMERMKQLAAAGYSKSSMVDNTAAIFDVMLASAGELTEQSAADLGISLERAFGSLRMDMRTALDTAVKAANQFPMTVGNIRDALGYATEAAVQSGQSLEETLLVIGSLMPITKTASKAGTVYRNAALTMVKPESQKILSELGVAAVDTEGKRRPLMDMFLDLNDQLNEVAKGKASKYYRSPERIAEEKAAAKAAGVKYEPKSLDKVFKQQLGLEREQLEFKLTGVRGGSIFAAVNRLVETTADKLIGTAFEGMKADTARTAFEVLRLGMSNAAGEAARLAGELRRTSKTLGESFDASLERFKIALGTTALPVKDAFLSVAKEVLDKFTSLLTPAPGAGNSYTPGSSVGLNTLGAFGGIATAGVIAYQAVQFGKALFQAKAIVGTVASSMATTTAAAGGLAGAFSGLVSFLTGPIGIALAATTAALFSFLTGIDAAYKAVTDFSDYLDRQNKIRTQKEERALGAMFEALAAGKLGIGANGQITGLNRGQMFDIAEAGPLAASVARFIAGGGDPTKAGEIYNATRREVIKKQYEGNPELQAQQLEALKVDEKRIIEEVMPKLIRTLFTSPDYKGGKGDRGTFGPDQLYSAYQVTKLNQAQRGYAPFASEFPTGGAEVDLRRNFMEQQGAKTMDEALAKAGFFDRNDFRLLLDKIPLTERLRPGSEPEIAALVERRKKQLLTSSDSLATTILRGIFGAERRSLDPDQQTELAEYEKKLRARPEAVTSIAQLDEQGRYNPAISAEARYSSPAVEAFLTAVGEGQKSMVRIPGFVEEIKLFLAKAATEKGQEKLEQSISRLNFPPINPMPPMVLEPEPNN
jgi:hypothetical protein